MLLTLIGACAVDGGAVGVDGGAGPDGGLGTAADNIACSPQVDGGDSLCSPPPPPPTNPCHDVGTIDFDLVCPINTYEFNVFVDSSGATTSARVWSSTNVEQSGTVAATTHATGDTCAMNVTWSNYGASLSGVERTGAFTGWGDEGIWGHVCTVRLRSRGYPHSS